MLAPQFLHVIPIELIVGPDPIEPIGIDPIGWGGIAPGVIAGLKTIPKIPPISPRRKPMTKPPKDEVAKLSTARIKTMAPHILCDSGFVYIITPPSIIMIPKIIPTIPRMPTVDPTPVAFAAPGVVLAKPEIKAPTKA
jgi:hypothetical protein